MQIYTGKADNDVRPDKLRSVDVKIVNRNVCQSCYNTPKVRFKITNEMICAGYLEGGRDACTGDSVGEHDAGSTPLCNLTTCDYF
jgi:secreted trypsin-like serine protease